LRPAPHFRQAVADKISPHPGIKICSPETSYPYGILACVVEYEGAALPKTNAQRFL
jgi:hypothetical protein